MDSTSLTIFVASELVDHGLLFCLDVWVENYDGPYVKNSGIKGPPEIFLQYFKLMLKESFFYFGTYL